MKQLLRLFLKHLNSRLGRWLMWLQLMLLRKDSLTHPSPRLVSSLLLFYESVCWALIGFIAGLIVSHWSSAAPVVMGPHYHRPRFTRMQDERSAEHGVACLPVIAWWMIPEGTAGGCFVNDISALRNPAHLLRFQMGSAGERPHLLVSNLEGLKTSEWPSSPLWKGL